MNTFIYVIYDKLSATYGQPFYQVNNSVAMRYFSEIMSTGIYKNNKEDFDLFKVGEFNFSTGELKPIKAEYIVNGGFANETK